MTEENTTTQANKTDKKLERKRKPFGVKNSKLQVENLDGAFSYRWFNDEPGRLNAALDAGYQFVTPKEVGRDDLKDTDKISEYAGVDRAGQPMKMYLMKIDKAFFMEDQEAKQKHLDGIDKAIKGGKLDSNSGDNRYDAGISIKNK